MRYASYVSSDGSETWGVERDGVLYDLGPSGKNLAGSLKAALIEGLFAADNAELEGAPLTDAETAEFLPPIVDPGKILCIGVNYRSHRDEVGKPAPSAPTVFTRFADSQLGHNRPAVRPGVSDAFDYEGELALVIGADAYQVTEEDSWGVIAGYGAYNDFSVRDWQKASTQWTAGKNFPNTGAFGPYLVPVSGIDDIKALKLETRVNGEVRQSATVADLIFDIPQIIAFVTAFTPLQAGDIIVTGTPGGVGQFMEPKGLLSHGDVVEVEITGLGVLSNPVVQG
jgi:2-keto-4-pentenoate hydratase/2-oxohepta-3-ene-1,7-dioic acid hydratase in catechol pathway